MGNPGVDQSTLTDGYPFELDNFDPDVDSITSEVIRPEVNAADRSIARRASLQVLYELDTTEHAFADVLDSHMAERPEAYRVRQIIRRFVSGILENKDAIDALLQRYAPDWPIGQVAVIDRNVLRIAIYEHLVQKRNTPVPVIINEAVHLAQLFGAEHSHSFVHGVLGTITSEMSPEAHLAGEESESQ